MVKYRDIRNIGSICFYQLKMQLGERRTRIALILLFFYLSGIMSPIKEFASKVQHNISPWMFPIIMNDLVCPIIIYSLWCFLICNTPFKNEGYLYYVGRAGKRNWLLGEILFLFLFSGLYAVIINVFLLLHSIPNLTFTTEWGKVIGTLAYTNATDQFAISMRLPTTMMSSFSPMIATMWSFVLMWCATFLLSLSVLAINWCLKVSWGVVISLGWIFLDITIYNILDEKWRRFSPLSLAKLSFLSGRNNNLTILWGFGFFACSIFMLLLLIASFIKIRKGIE